MRAQILGVALAAAPGEGVYVPLGHRYLGAPKQLAWEQLRDVLIPLCADPTVRTVAYDLKRLEDVLARHGVRIEGKFCDALLAGYLLVPEAPHEL